MAAHSKHTQKSRAKGGVIACLAVICALLIALGALGIYTLQTVEKLKKSGSSAEGAWEEQLADAQAQIAQQQSTIDEQKNTIDEQQGIINEQQGTIEEQQGTIEEQQGTIEEQQDTIDEKQDEIDDLKVQIALRDTAPGDPNLPALGPFDDYEGQKIVALTFDDGPGPYTERLLDELQERDARATFFVLGTRVDAYPRLIRRMAAEGHVVGNHSNAHNMLHKMDLVGVRKEMGKCAEKIEQLLGYRPPVMRCPGGNSSETVKEYAKEAGVPILYWSVDTRDWESRNKEAILEVSKKNIEDGSIVLLHDIHKESVDAAIELMDWLIDEGYTLVTVPELLYARYGEMEAGKTYLGK